MQHLNLDEVLSLLRAISTVQPTGRPTVMPASRQRLMILVSFHHGLRISETINLKGANLTDGFIKVKRLKGSLPTVQPFIAHDNAELDEAKGLRELMQTVKPKERLFPITRFGAYKLLQRAGERANLPQHLMHPHILKHSIAMQTIKVAGIENVRNWLGHKSIASTGEYLKVDGPSAARAIAAAMGANTTHKT